MGCRRGYGLVRIVGGMEARAARASKRGAAAARALAGSLAGAESEKGWLCQRLCGTSLTGARAGGGLMRQESFFMLCVEPLERSFSVPQAARPPRERVSSMQTPHRGGLHLHPSCTPIRVRHRLRLANSRCEEGERRACLGSPSQPRPLAAPRHPLAGGLPQQAGGKREHPSAPSPPLHHLLSWARAGLLTQTHGRRSVLQGGGRGVGGGW